MANAFCAKRWHDKAACNVVPVSGANGVGVWLMCIPCRQVANLEALTAGHLVHVRNEDVSGGPCKCEQRSS